MGYVVLTACTNRKRVSPEPGMQARAMAPAALAAVAESWLARVRTASCEVQAGSLYAGRGFVEARTVAANGNLYIVSAGLGVVAASLEVPAYDLTIAPGATDNVLALVTDTASPSDWWEAGPARSPFATRLQDLAALHPGELILAALPGTYLLMVADDLSRLADRVEGRLRLFCAAPPSGLPGQLGAALMPYDSRLDGPDSPLPGTIADFAQRAMRHFVEVVVPGAPAGSDAATHRAGVERALTGLRSPASIHRARATDAEILELIARHWGRADGRSTRMLRLIRDELGRACEQGRFVRLFQEAAAQRAVSLQ